MSASFCWVSWNPPAGGRTARARSAVRRWPSPSASGPRRARPTRCRTAPRSGRTAGPSGRAPRGRRVDPGSRTLSSTNSEVTEARRTSCAYHLGALKPGGVGGDHEAADAVVGLRPTPRRRRPRAVGDPHLGAVEHPVVAVAPGVGAHPGRGRSRSRARSGRSSRSPHRRPSAAATPASAPRCPNFQIANIASEPCTDTSDRTPSRLASSSRHASP
jgi:hypothetical protein